MKTHTLWTRLRNPIALLLVLLTLLGTSVARADTTPSTDGNVPESITLAEALARARNDAPTVLQAIAQQDASNAQYGLARSALLPVVTGTLALSTGGGMGSSTSGSQGQGSGPAAVDAAVSAHWTIWDFGRTSDNLTAARNIENASAHDAVAAQRNAESQTAAAFFVVLADQAVIQSDGAIVAQRTQELDITRGLVTAGTGQPIDLTRAQVTLNAAQLDLLNARALLSTDTAALAAAFGMDPTTTLQPVAPGSAIAVDADPTLAANRAIETRPEVAAAQDLLAAAESALSAARGAYLPSLVTSASADAGGQLLGSGNIGPRASASASLGIAIPIFDPTLSSSVRLAAANVASARAALDGAKLAVRTDAVQAADQVQSATQVDTQAEQLASVAAANLSQAEGRYRAGVAPMLELVDAQSADATARTALIRAQFQLDLARVHLLAATANLDTLAAHAAT